MNVLRHITRLESLRAREIHEDGIPEFAIPQQHDVRIETGQVEPVVFQIPQKKQHADQEVLELRLTQMLFATDEGFQLRALKVSIEDVKLVFFNVKADGLGGASVDEGHDNFDLEKSLATDEAELPQEHRLLGRNVGGSVYLGMGAAESVLQLLVAVQFRIIFLKVVITFGRDHLTQVLAAQLELAVVFDFEAYGASLLLAESETDKIESEPAGVLQLQEAVLAEVASDLKRHPQRHYSAVTLPAEPLGSNRARKPEGELHIC